MLPFKLIIILLLFSGWDTSKADDWPNWMGSSNDGIWHEEGILKKFPENGNYPRSIQKAENRRYIKLNDLEQPK